MLLLYLIYFISLSVSYLSMVAMMNHPVYFWYQIIHLSSLNNSDELARWLPSK